LVNQLNGGRIVWPAAPAVSRGSAEYLWGKHFWSPSYYAASRRGPALTIIKQYIDQQKRPDGKSTRNASRKNTGSASSRAVNGQPSAEE
jgi:hypothetical protein